MAPSAQILKDRYVGDSVSTASPARLLVMLYDRLLNDLTNGEIALRESDPARANAALCHAQEIVLELRASLKVELWVGGPALASLYGYIVTELMKAMTGRDPDLVAKCHELVEPLADAWRQAAAEVTK